MTPDTAAQDDDPGPIDVAAVFRQLDEARAAGGSADHRATLAGPTREVTDVPLAELLGPIRTEPPAASNWRRGASGERRTAALLAPLTRLGWAVLHDRRIPGSAANLDHLVVGPHRVFVVDSKAYRGRIKLLGDGRLWYGRTPLADTLATVRWATDEVSRQLSGVLARSDATLGAVMCLHGVTLPNDPMPFAGVTLTTPGQLLRLLTAGSAKLATDPGVARLAAAARARFPAARR